MRASKPRNHRPTLILLGSAKRQSFKDAALWMHETIPVIRLIESPIAGHAAANATWSSSRFAGYNWL
jgi:hypothetical protein